MYYEFHIFSLTSFVWWEEISGFLKGRKSPTCSVYSDVNPAGVALRHVLHWRRSMRTGTCRKYREHVMPWSQSQLPNLWLWESGKLLQASLW